MRFRKHKGLTFALAALLVAWTAVVLSFYYLVHKPIHMQQAAAIGSLLWLVAALLGTICLAHILGGIWRKPLAPLEPGARLVVRTGAGLALLSLAALALGSVRAYALPVAPLATLIAIPVGLPALWRSIKAVRIPAPKNRLDRWFLALLLILIAVALLPALAPPTAWDSLVYHLTGPRLYIAAGGLHHEVDLPYLGFPQGGSMLFLWALLLSSPALAQVVHLCFAVMTFMLLISIARSLIPGAEWASAAILAAIPSAILLAGWAYVEWMTMFAALAAFRLLLKMKEGHQPSITGYLMVGFMLGFALATKYSAVGLVAGVALAAAVVTGSARMLGAASLGVLTGFGPFLLKNWALTGNPVYPFFLSGRFWDMLRASWYSRPGTGLGLDRLLLAPWEASIWGVEGGAVLGAPSYGADLGPALLFLLPTIGILLMAEKPDRWSQLRLVALVSGIAYLAWLGMLAYSGLLIQSRLLFPALPFLALLCAAGLEAVRKLGRRGSSAHFILRAVLAFVLFMTALGAAMDLIERPVLPVVLGAVTRDGYLQERLGEHMLAMNALVDLPADSQVRFLWEPRSYYCPAGITCDPDALLDRWWHARRTLGSAAEIATAWRRGGFTHVLLFHLGREQVELEGFDAFSAEDWETLDTFIQSELILLESTGPGYSLYRLRTLGR